MEISQAELKELISASVQEALTQQQATKQKSSLPPQKALGLTATVASIFPLPRTLRKPMFIEQVEFSLPAVPRGKAAATLLIRDQSERVYAGFGKNTSKIIPAIEVAADFVDNATKLIMGCRDGGSPGVWIVGTLEGGNLTLEQETAIMLDRQNKFFQEWVDDAREHAAKHEFADITPMHRIAADWHNIKGETWQLELHKQDLEKCRYCKEYIDRQAVKCPKCSGIVNPERYAQMLKEEEELIASVRGGKKSKREEAVSVA